jgi:hypothetical protein
MKAEIPERTMLVALPESMIGALLQMKTYDGVPGRGVAGGGPRVFRRQSGPVMFRAQPRA